MRHWDVSAVATTGRQAQHPEKVLAEAYTNNPATKADDLAAIRRVRKLCAETGVLGRCYRPWWRLLGLHDPVDGGVGRC